MIFIFYGDVDPDVMYICRPAFITIITKETPYIRIGCI